MATLRREVFIDRPADEVWAVVGDPAALSTWFTSILETVVEGTQRRCKLATGFELIEDIVTLDHRLRRFQYRLVGGVPIGSHLATVDVIDLGVLGGGSGSVVVYGTDVTPDAMAYVLQGAIGEALLSLKALLERVEVAA